MKTLLKMYTVCILASTIKKILVKVKTDVVDIYVSFIGKGNSVGLQKGAAFLPEKQT